MEGSREREKVLGYIFDNDVCTYDELLQWSDMYQDDFLFYSLDQNYVNQMDNWVYDSKYSVHNCLPLYF